MCGISIEESLDRMIARHNSWANAYDSDMAEMVLYNRVTLDNITRFLPKDHDGVILDAGGGTGFWAIQLAKMGYHIMLTDIATGMLDKARENVSKLGLDKQIEIRLSDIRDMPEFSEGQFAMVVCQGDPVSYCGDHEAAIRELARVVTRGGMVMVSVDSRAAALNWLRESNDFDAIDRLVDEGEILPAREREEFSYWVHAFTADELKALFESNGLSVERLIGKLAIADRVPRLRNSEDAAVRERLLQLEMKYCDDPAYLPWAAHLEIAGRKR